MRITAIDVTADRAVVEMRPCWLARWFGARTERVTIVRQRYGDGSHRGWVMETTETSIPWDLRDDIMRALDFRPVDALPEARTVQR